jgi:hypothetical protein
LPPAAVRPHGTHFHFHMMPVLKAVTCVQTAMLVLFREFFRNPYGTNFAEVKSVVYDFIGSTVIDLHLVFCFIDIRLSLVEH